MAIFLPRELMTILEDSFTAKTAKQLVTNFIVADDNLVIYAGTSWNIVKELRFIRDTTEMNSSTLSVKAEGMSSIGTTNVGFFINSEIVPRINLSTVGTGFELLSGTCYIGDLSNGVNSIKINLQNLYNGTSYQKLVEIYNKF